MTSDIPMHPDTLIPLAFFAVFLLFGGVAVAASLKQQRRARKNLADLASRLRLDLKRPPARMGFEPTPTVEGTHRNRRVRFFNYTTGSGKSRTTWSAVAADAPGAGAFTLALIPENFLLRTAAALGMQDIQTGDPAFDRAFNVKSNDPTYAAAALLPEIRARLLDERGRGAHGQLKVEHDQVRYSEIGTFGTAGRADRLAAMLEPVCDLAEAVDVYRKP